MWPRVHKQSYWQCCKNAALAATHVAAQSGQQRIEYSIVASQLYPQEHRVAQLTQSVQAAQEGIALLIVAGIQSDAFQQVDEDLSALTIAVRSVASVTEINLRPAYIRR